MSTLDREKLERELKELDRLLELAKEEDGENPSFLSDEDHPLLQRLRRSIGGDEALPDHIALVLNAAQRALDRVESAFQNLPHQNAEARTDVYERLLRAQTYIETNFANDIDLSSMAQEAAMSNFHFLRLFKIAFGQTPYQYLLNYRLGRSKDLLLTTELPIYEIAEQCGFESNVVFASQFKQVVGMPPSRYRMMGGR